MIERTQDRFGLYPERLAADSAYGSAEMLGWLVARARDRAAHPGLRQVGAQRRHLRARPTSPTITRRDVYICPGGKELRQYRRPLRDAAARRR